jgi:hypothetical protein
VQLFREIYMKRLAIVVGDITDHGGTVNRYSDRIGFLIAYICIAGGLWAASQWWERGLAEPLGEPDISPNGCYRVETYKPFWVLPNIFHRKPHPDGDMPPKWFPVWSYPGFYRLYDHRTNALIAESEIYDLTSASGKLDWGSKRWPEVSAGYVVIGPNATDCIGDRTSRPEPVQ